MPLAALLALAVLAAEPAPIPPEDAPMARTAPSQTPAPANAGPAEGASSEATDENDDVPASAPKDDYGFVAWCYGALDEYLNIYEVVKPDLKAIDKLFGTPVVEAEPYSADVAEDRKALKRFAAAIKAAEKVSPRAMSDAAAEATKSGRAMWAAARTQPSRRLADAWLYWGVPAGCDRAALRLQTHAPLSGQAIAAEPPAKGPAQPVAVAPDQSPSQ